MKALTYLSLLLASGVCQGIPSQELELRLGAAFGTFHILNHGPGIRLSSTVRVEQQIGWHWVAAPVTNLFLTENCATKQIPDCLTLPADGKLNPVPWRGNYCYSQCPASCDLDSPAPPGMYRLVISTCDNKNKIVSPAFEKD